MLNSFDKSFWQMLDKLILQSNIVIDRPKGTHHPKYPDIVYNADYGYLDNTQSMDGNGIDVWQGTLKNNILDAIICTVDIFKKDSEIKLLIGCNDEEKEIVYKFHNENEYMKGILIKREPK